MEKKSPVLGTVVDGRGRSYLDMAFLGFLSPLGLGMPIEKI